MRVAALLMLAIAAACCAHNTIAQTLPTQLALAAAAAEPMVLAVTLNGEPQAEPVFLLRTASGDLLIDEAALSRWRIPFTPDRRVTDDGRAYQPVAVVPGMTIEIDSAKQTASITLPGTSFRKESIPFEAQSRTAPMTPGWGGFFNYNLFGQNSASVTTGSGLFEPGIFGPYGVGTMLVGANSATALGTTQRVVRFDANWRYDDPARLTTLIAGDAVSRVGSWGQAVRFGGLQYGTNFALQPQFLPFPLQAVSGIATVPSTADIFINNAKVGEQQLQPGPFTITNIPIVSGAGNVQVVVKDAFGREQVIAQPFYSSQAMLRQGLSDYSIEAGSLRRNFGIESNDYSGWMGSALYRYGFTDSLTGEVRAETSDRLAAAGVHADYQVDDLGIASVGLVGSHSTYGSGTKWLAGVQRQTSPWAFSLNGEWNTSGFRQVGTLDEPLQLVRQATVATSVDIGSLGSIGFAYAAQQYRNARATDVGTATYSVPLGGRVFLSVTATRVVALTNQSSISVAVTIPIDMDTFTTFGAQHTRGPTGDSGFESVNLQRNLPPGDGYGYRIYGESDRRYQATGYYNGPYGTYSVGAAQADHVTAVQANISGGFGLVGGQAFASRQLLGSFGVARVSDIEGVEVLAQNQVVGTTNSSGFAVIPQLNPYDQNVVSINPLTVPMSATIDGTSRTVVPYIRSGVLIDFPVQVTHGGTLTIMLDDGKPAPEGAVVTLAGNDTPFPVGYGGEAYVVGLHEGANDLLMHWRGSSCALVVPASTSRDPVPDLGSYVCAGVKR